MIKYTHKFDKLMEKVIKNLYPWKKKTIDQWHEQQTGATQSHLAVDAATTRSSAVTSPTNQTKKKKLERSSKYSFYFTIYFKFCFLFLKKQKCQKRSKQLLPGRCASAFRQIGDAQVVDADGVIVIDAGHTRHSHRLPRRTASVGKPINSQIKKSIKNSSIEPKEKNHKINKPSCQRASQSKKKNGRYANQVVAPKKNRGGHVACKRRENPSTRTRRWRRLAASHVRLRLQLAGAEWEMTLHAADVSLPSSKSSDRHPLMHRPLMDSADKKPGSAPTQRPTPSVEQSRNQQTQRPPREPSTNSPVEDDGSVR